MHRKKNEEKIIIIRLLNHLDMFKIEKAFTLVSKVFNCHFHYILDMPVTIGRSLDWQWLISSPPFFLVEELY